MEWSLRRQSRGCLCYCENMREDIVETLMSRGYVDILACDLDSGFDVRDRIRSFLGNVRAILGDSVEVEVSTIWDKNAEHYSCSVSLRARIVDSIEQ